MGRLAEAVEPMLASAEADVRRSDWINAASNYGNLSELQLTLGQVTEAVMTARESVKYADCSGNALQFTARRTTLAHALLQSGGLASAQTLFGEAEHRHAKKYPTQPLLFSVQGYRYCNLLLAAGEDPEVLHRTKRTLVWATDLGILLNIGLDHLTLGRAHPADSAKRVQHLDQAVDFLRRAGRLDYLSLALLARATDADLAEVHRIASRSGMKLHLADYHLAMARRQQSKDHLEKATKLIDETDYHRRDREVAELRALLDE